MNARAWQIPNGRGIPPDLRTCEDISRIEAKSGSRRPEFGRRWSFFMATGSSNVTLDQEINPWEAQSARFDFAARKLNLDEGLWKVLRSPSREIIVHFPWRSITA
jgi:hypothetical protein